MGNVSSLTSASSDVRDKLSPDEKGAIERLAKTADKNSSSNDHTADQDNYTLSFEHILARYITNGTEIDGVKTGAAEHRLSQLLYADKHTQTKAIRALSAIHSTTEENQKQLKPLSLYQFVQATCTQAMAGFWKMLPADILSEDVEWLARKCLVESKQAITRINGTAANTMSFLVEDVGENWQRAARKWIQDAKTSGKVSESVWQIWWDNSPMFRELLSMALSSAIYLVPDKEIIKGTRLLMAQSPEIKTQGFLSKNARASAFLLSPATGWALGRELPRSSQNSWLCVYSSRRDGRSWSTFQNKIEKQGSILVLIRETRKPESTAEPRVFGAYFDADIDRKPGWTGNSLNFLFTHAIDRNDIISGGLEVYRSSGFNDHYQYFNYGTKTLPNGLGAGGQMGHFGLWIESAFVSGSSDSAATFESGQLSSSRDFGIDCIEAWLVRPTERLDEDVGAQKSVLETNAEAAALLELANKKFYSKTVPPDQVKK
ncbi:hypothetical protein H4R99_002166 [Coemansia sp. RSA 1722]|nr:hypothetical protein H4R99_002166 [Coemansia sp. RSA 1722]